VYLVIAFEREEMSEVIEGESDWRIGIGETKLLRVARTFDRQSLLTSISGSAIVVSEKL
jgi:hypothetical protein